MGRSRAERERGGGHVLHERHDRDAEGRAVLAPLDDAAHARRRSRQPDGARDLGAGRDPARRADVPRERLGLSVSGDDARREPRLPGAVPRSREPARRVRLGRGHVDGGRPDDLARDPEHARREPRQVGSLADEGDARRRLGRATVADRRVQAAARLERRPRLGHDRDVPGRVDRAAARRVVGGRRGHPVRLPRDAGTAFAARRASPPRRRRPTAALGRGGDGRARDSRALGCRRLLRDARPGRAMDGRRLVQDRRRGLDPSARVHPDQGPLQGRDQVGRRVDLVGRARERADGAPGDHGGGGDRGAGREVGRAASGCDRSAGGSRGDGRRAARVSRAGLREVLATRPLRVHRRDPEDERRQVPQDRAARDVRERAGAAAAP